MTRAEIAADMPRAHRLVILESPYAGDVEANVAYARRCVKSVTFR